MKKIYVLLLMLFCAAFYLVGCQSQEPVPTTVAINTTDLYVDYTPLSQQEFTNAIQPDETLNLELTHCESRLQMLDIAQKAVDSGAEALVVCLTDSADTQALIDIVRKKNISLLLYGRAPDFSVTDGYDKCWYVGDVPQQAGELAGEILAQANANGLVPDVNGDMLLQYAMLESRRGDFYSDSMRQYTITAIEDSGLFTSEISVFNIPSLQATPAEQPQNAVAEEPLTMETFWDETSAQGIAATMLATTEKDIEAFICADTNSALGVVTALEEAGFYGETSAYTPVIVSNGIDDTLLSYIQEGKILGTVVYDSKTAASVLSGFLHNILNCAPVNENMNLYIDAHKSVYLSYLKVTQDNLTTIQ
ncbi:MAG: substrate-binding domain-containing protein [Oscillospiraceae bacterium]|nr:substrate-binding domain-containing protein [Oscillospiraceae bacterium]